MTPHTRYRAPDGGIWRVTTEVDRQGRHKVQRNRHPSKWLKAPLPGWVALCEPWGRRPVEHTADSLLAMADEVGDCRIWRGYRATRNTVPYVNHGGEMKPVRRLLAGLLDIPEGKIRGGFWVARCGDPACIAPAHLMRRTEREHSRAMNKAMDTKPVTRAVRAAKIAAKAAAWRKLTDAQIDEIMTSDETAADLARKFGVSRALVTRYRRGELGPGRGSAGAAMAQGNPWAGLMAA